MPGEGEANLGGAHEAVLAVLLSALLIVMRGEFGGDGVKEEGEAPLDAVLEALGKVVGVLGVNSIETFQLEFWLEKSLEFCLEIPHTKKKLKNGQFGLVSESKWNL